MLIEKIIPRGTHHKASLSVSSTTKQYDVCAMNERLLDQNDLGFFAHVMSMSSGYVSLASFWLTNTGLYYITTPIQEYYFRIQRAVLEHRPSVQRHLDMFTKMTDIQMPLLLQHTRSDTAAALLLRRLVDGAEIFLGLDYARVNQTDNTFNFTDDGSVYTREFEFTFPTQIKSAAEFNMCLQPVYDVMIKSLPRLSDAVIDYFDSLDLHTHTPDIEHVDMNLWQFRNMEADLGLFVRLRTESWWRRYLMGVFLLHL